MNGIHAKTGTWPRTDTLPLWPATKAEIRPGDHEREEGNNPKSKKKWKCQIYDGERGNQ